MSNLPSAVFLCGLNLLPVIFKFVARRVERVRCFRRDSPLYWLQGHAVWHVLTMGALFCIYWFFRSERLVE